jgi:trans-aconitate 2-methyltransferase
MTQNNYTFGDSVQASGRLHLLAEVYEPETRELLLRGNVRSPRLAVDLGCGPGWSTKLIKDVLNPQRTVGLDTSERYVEEARRTQGADLEFSVHDVVNASFPVSEPDVLFCRFLLTHLRALPEVLATWASVAAPCALLFVHETETLETDHPALRRYYEMVAEMQQHYGQVLLVGAVLEECFEKSGWKIVSSERRILEKPAQRMAALHAANIRTWRNDAYASHAFVGSELDSLQAALDEIAGGLQSAGIVYNAARQIIARRA